MKKFWVILLITMLALPVFASKKEAQPNIPSQTFMNQKGYEGSLPDIIDKFQPSKPASATPVFEAEEGFDDPDKLKPTPRDNPAFVNIILKKDKTSTYIYDINKIILLVEALIDCIENEENVQLFVAKATNLEFAIGGLRDSFEGKPESYYTSYVKLMSLCMHVKAMAELRREGAEYNRYLAYQAAGSVFAPDNVNKELHYLLDELQEVLVILREVE